MERRPLVCFVVPVLNEAPNLPRLIASARVLAAELCPAYDVRFFIVDDGSTDGTKAAALGLADGLTLTVLRHDTNLGPGRAFATGFAHLAELLGPDDWVVTMEGDNTSRPELLRTMFVRSREGYDVVLASPYLYGGAIEHTTAWRVILSRIANVFVKEILGLTGIATVSSFYRLYRASAVLHLQRCYGPGIVERAGFECMIELLLKMVFLRVTISEVPMTLDVALRAGNSKLKIVRTILGYFAVWRSARRWRESARTLATAGVAGAASSENLG
jgi:dolichol-phosphate mannosyltransferase